MKQNKKAQINVIVGILTGVMIVVMLTFFYVPLEETKSFFKNSKILSNDEFSDTNELHWGHMPITYSFYDKENIYSLRVERLEFAMQEISRLTNNFIIFEEVEYNGDIVFVGTKIMEIDRLDMMQTLGEAEYDMEGDLIIGATIWFYGGIEKNCLDYPSVEIHEILHTFGIEHKNHVSSVMSPIENSCIDEIRLDVDGETFERLIEIYGNEQITA